jgi:hypothetical protein
MFTHETTYAIALIVALVAGAVTTFVILSDALQSAQVF